MAACLPARTSPSTSGTCARELSSGTSRPTGRASWSLAHEVEAPWANVNCVTFSPDGKHLVLGSADGTLRFCDTTDGSLRLALFTLPPQAAAAAPAGGRPIEVDAKPLTVGEKRL